MIKRYVCIIMLAWREKGHNSFLKIGSFIKKYSLTVLIILRDNSVIQLACKFTHLHVALIDIHINVIKTNFYYKKTVRHWFLCPNTMLTCLSSNVESVGKKIVNKKIDSVRSQANIESWLSINLIILKLHRWQ